MRHHVIILATALMASVGSSMSAGSAAAGDLSGMFAPPATNGSCVMRKTEYSTGINEQTTNSTSFTNVGDAGAITFIQKRVGCVAGTFFANVGNNTANDNVHLQVLLDGTACSPVNTGDYVFANSGTDFSSHAVGFFCGGAVPLGSHTVQVQWAAGVGGQAQMFQHTLEVTHR